MLVDCSTSTALAGCTFKKLYRPVLPWPRPNQRVREWRGVRHCTARHVSQLCHIYSVLVTMPLHQMLNVPKCRHSGFPMQRNNAVFKVLFCNFLLLSTSLHRIVLACCHARRGARSSR